MTEVIAAVDSFAELPETAVSARAAPRGDSVPGAVSPTLAAVRWPSKNHRSALSCNCLDPPRRLVPDVTGAGRAILPSTGNSVTIVPGLPGNLSRPKSTSDLGPQGPPTPRNHGVLP